MKTFNPNGMGISLYVTLFERQTKKKKRLEKGDWAKNLLSLLPMDINQIVLNEPELDTDNWECVKQLLLKPFKLSPESFKNTFK